ncbi:hypothetical protein F4604DRAFT_1687138 [Suillus subluteus]|nr:hypothetical protein F4604DRAFT_1687138 [Suillus subluteus]
MVRRPRAAGEPLIRAPAPLDLSTLPQDDPATQHLIIVHSMVETGWLALLTALSFIISTNLILLELNVPEDPIRTYFDSQHKHIMDRMNATDRTGVSNIDAMKSRMTPDLSSSNAPRQILDVQLQCRQAALSNFWKIARSFLKGKFKRPSSSRRSASQCKQMALDIIKLYISFLSEFFILSDVLSTSSTPNSAEHLPSHLNSLTTTYWLVKIISEVQDCITEVGALELREGGLVKGLVESVRWRFEDDVLVRFWLRDANYMYALKSSTPNLFHNALPRSSRIIHAPPRNVRIQNHGWC